MHRRSLLAGAAALAAAPTTAFAQAAKTKIVFWHAMTGANGDEINRIARDFNASQSAVEVEAIFKGSYPETLTAAIAAWRAGQAPHIAQVYEVGTGSMLAAGPAVKQVWQLAQETGLKIDPATYLPAVRGYYSLADGRMASMPFNSSTAVMWYNKDAFEMAGLDPEKPPAPK
jgi:sn-glycerol 3-phosphate transport system substrate-binding protein